MSKPGTKGGSLWRWATGLLVIGAAIALYQVQWRNDPADPDLLRSDVAIKCAETGFEWKLNRGRMEQYLYMMAAEGKLDPSLGLENPKTGKRTGFPVDRADWERTVARIKREQADAAAKMSGGK